MRQHSSAPKTHLTNCSEPDPRDAFLHPCRKNAGDALYALTPVRGFISVIAWFSLLGIALGVATLIIVMSVMNGFRAELVGRILGLNGHLAVYADNGRGIADFDPLSVRIATIPGVLAVTPQIEGQVMASSKGMTSGAVVRGVRWADLVARKPLWDSLDDSTLKAFKTGDQICSGIGWRGRWVSGRATA